MTATEAILGSRRQLLRFLGFRPEMTAGLALAAVLSVVAVTLDSLEQRTIGHALIEALVLALLLGVVVRNVIPRPGTFVAGTAFAAKQVLELGVGLLGASIDFRQVVAAGPSLLILTVAGVFGGIGVSFLAGRAMRLNTTLAILVAVGNSICGNSAIAAVAPVIRAEKKDVASAIALTAVLGVCLVLGLPLLMPLFRLNDYQYGVLAGMSVYAVPQVVAASFPVSQLSGEVATLVKLSRVVLLGPVVMMFAVIFRARGAEGQARRGWSTYVPWFVALFFLLAAARTSGLLGTDIAGTTRNMSRLLTILAMAGLGFGVELAAVRRVGPRVGTAVILALLFMISLTLVLIQVLGING